MAVKTSKDDKQGTGALVDYDQSKGTSTRKPGQRGRVPGRQNAPQNFNNRDREGGGSFDKPKKKKRSNILDLADIIEKNRGPVDTFVEDRKKSLADAAFQPEVAPDFMSFFSKALELAKQNQGGGTDYAALRDRLTQNAGDSDARVAAMYKQLQGSYAADQPGIDQSYEQAKASSAGVADEAAANTNQAYDQARQTQMAMLQELGIGDAAAVINQQAGNAANDQATAVGNIEQNKNAVQQQLGTNQQNAGTFNTQIGQAAGLEGNMQRATIQKALQDKLAELDVQSQQESAQRSQNSLSQASSIAGALSDDWYRNKGFQQDQTDADYQKQIEMQKLLQQQATSQQFDPQTVIDQVASMTAGGKDVSLRDQAAMMDALRKLLSGG